MDYNWLEGVTCLCGQKKLIGQKLCISCWQRLPDSELAKLSKMRPGDGIASAVSIAHSEEVRRRIRSKGMALGAGLMLFVALVEALKIT